MEEVLNDNYARQLSCFIRDASFPCVMAKAVERIGRIKLVTATDLIDELSVIHKSMCEFVDEFRAGDKLSSFILVCDDPRYRSFEKFETEFWKFLNHLRRLDRTSYPHDPRVSDNPESDDFSFSVKSEAFFILIIHPDSPRWARRFKYPAIVFNPHVQFERMRLKGVFSKIREIIRKRDMLLQGTINPMLSDFGERSEAFQYTGRTYTPDERIPLL